MTPRFTGKTILVTGAAAGLGRAHALAFAGEGAHIILADIDMDGLQESRALIQGRGGSAEYHRCDMAVEADIHHLAQSVMAQHQKLDVLINNAGLHQGEIARGFSDLNQEKWQRFLAINSLGPLLLAEALRAPLAAAKGLVINKSSMASYNPATAYGITKGLLNILTHAMATQFSVDQIRCVAIAPGLMETPAAKEGIADEHWQRLMSMQAVQRQGTADDIAQFALFLASDEGSFINNQVLTCDGGHQMRGFRY